MPILADILCKDMIKIGNYNELEVVKKKLTSVFILMVKNMAKS